jgi:hypothetical protein
MRYVELVQDHVKFWFNNVKIPGFVTRGMGVNYFSSKEKFLVYGCISCEYHRNMYANEALSDQVYILPPPPPNQKSQIWMKTNCNSVLHTLLRLMMHNMYIHETGIFMLVELCVVLFQTMTFIPVVNSSSTLEECSSTMFGIECGGRMFI